MVIFFMILLPNKERLIIWDQTNLDSKTRRKKLQKIPSDYVKFAFVFDTPSDETLNERIEQRKDKVIPRNILDGMISRFESPTEAEGFDVIIYVGEKKDTNNE
jgi:tRNA uridine 5-carbamoylmethylation protein Kti12